MSSLVWVDDGVLRERGRVTGFMEGCGNGCIVLLSEVNLRFSPGCSRTLPHGLRYGYQWLSLRRLEQLSLAQHQLLLLDHVELLRREPRLVDHLRLLQLLRLLKKVLILLRCSLMKLLQIALGLWRRLIARSFSHHQRVFSCADSVLRGP